MYTYQKYKCVEVTECKLYMRVDDTKNYKRDNPVSMTRRIQNTGRLAFEVFRIFHCEVYNNYSVGWCIRNISSNREITRETAHVDLIDQLLGLF